MTDLTKDWLDSLIEQFTYGGLDGSSYGTDDAKDDRAFLKQAITDKLREARLGELREILQHGVESNYSTQEYDQAIKDRIAELKAALRTKVDEYFGVEK